MGIEASEELSALLDAKLAPLRAEIERLSAQMNSPQPPPAAAEAYKWADPSVRGFLLWYHSPEGREERERQREDVRGREAEADKKWKRRELLGDYLVDGKGIALRYGISKSTLSLWCKTGKFPGHRLWLSAVHRWEEETFGFVVLGVSGRRIAERAKAAKAKAAAERVLTPAHIAALWFIEKTPKGHESYGPEPSRHSPGPFGPTWQELKFLRRLGLLALDVERSIRGGTYLNSVSMTEAGAKALRARANAALLAEQETKWGTWTAERRAADEKQRRQYERESALKAATARQSSPLGIAERRISELEAQVRRLVSRRR